jgi:hypothetical protein
MPNTEGPNLESFDGDRHNREWPQALAKYILDPVRSDSASGVWAMNLVNFTRTIPPGPPSGRLCFPDTLHFRKLMCNRGMDPAMRLVPAPTIDFVFPVREFALGAGIPPPVLEPKRKLHDSNPLHITFSSCVE